MFLQRLDNLAMYLKEFLEIKQTNIRCMLMRTGSLYIIINYDFPSVGYVLAIFPHLKEYNYHKIEVLSLR